MIILFEKDCVIENYNGGCERTLTTSQIFFAESNLVTVFSSGRSYHLPHYLMVNTRALANDIILI